MLSFPPVSWVTFLKKNSEHPRIKVGFAFVVAVAAASLLFNHPLPLVSPKIKAASIPKGPTGLPMLGSFLSLKRYPERTLDRWAKYYGPIYSVWLGNQLFIIVSEPGIAKGLMATHVAVFSDRKEMFIKSQTVLVGRGITASPYGKRW
ncbi:hypothetical protein PMIN02_013016 [Paraphaeosphaeria minitans]